MDRIGGRTSARSLLDVGLDLVGMGSMKDCPCDGCDLIFEVGELACELDLGHECRYCPSCHMEYQSWQTAVQAMEKRLQAELDTWQREAREQVRLKRVPTDFPIVRRGSGQPLVLG